MNSFEIGMKSRRIEKELKDTTGNEFERNAQFILHLCFKKYRKTRLNKDGGIDGYIYTEAFIIKGTNRPVEYFSIYGPEAKTQTKDRIKKLKQDFLDINRHANEWGIKIKKWYIVINFDTTTEIQAPILSLCKEHEIKVEILYPTKIVQMLDNDEKLFKALAFTDQVEYPNVSMTALHYHEFTKRALQMIVDKLESSTTEQLSLLRGLHQSILFFTPNNINSPFHKNTSPSYLDYWLYKNTKLSNEESIYVHEYDLIRKKLITFEKEHLWEELMPPDQIIYKSYERNAILIKVLDLQFIYSFVIILYHQIISQKYTHYDLEKAFNRQSVYIKALHREFEQFERFKRKQKKQYKNARK